MHGAWEILGTSWGGRCCGWPCFPFQRTSFLGKDVILGVMLVELMFISSTVIELELSIGCKDLNHRGGNGYFYEYTTYLLHSAQDVLERLVCIFLCLLWRVCLCEWKLMGSEGCFIVQKQMLLCLKILFHPKISSSRHIRYVIWIVFLWIIRNPTLTLHAIINLLWLFVYSICQPICP